MKKHIVVPIIFLLLVMFQREFFIDIIDFLYRIVERSFWHQNIWLIGLIMKLIQAIIPAFVLFALYRVKLVRVIQYYFMVNLAFVVTSYLYDMIFPQQILIGFILQFIFTGGYVYVAYSIYKEGLENVVATIMMKVVIIIVLINYVISYIMIFDEISIILRIIPQFYGQLNWIVSTICLAVTLFLVLKPKEVIQSEEQR